MAGFDRIKPPQKRLSERDDRRQPDSDMADQAGRAALFSASDVPVRGRADAATGAESGRQSRSEVDADLNADGPPLEGPPQVDPPPRAEHVTTPPRADGAPTDASDPRLPQGRSALNVECGHCGVTCPMPLSAVAKRAFPMAVVVPLKSHPVFATCPCGERRTWLKPTLGLPR